jgi:hypothetical protein
MCEEGVRYAFPLVRYVPFRNVCYQGVGKKRITPFVCGKVLQVLYFVGGGVGRAHRERVEEMSGACSRLQSQRPVLITGQADLRQMRT